MANVTETAAPGPLSGGPAAFTTNIYDPATYAYNPDSLRVHIENAEGVTKVLFDGQQ